MDVSQELPEGDYTLIDGAAWFTIKNFSVRVYATDEGVVCDIYCRGREMHDALGSTYAFDADANPDND